MIEDIDAFQSTCTACVSAVPMFFSLQGAQVDELFTDKRWDRIENNRELEEHTPWSVGSERLKKFESKGIIRPLWCSPDFSEPVHF